MNGDLSVRGRFFQIDALWERERVAVELDSHSVHGTKKRFESDRHRDRILAAEGWRILHVTWRGLHEDRARSSRIFGRRLGRAITHTHPASRCG